MPKPCYRRSPSVQKVIVLQKILEDTPMSKSHRPARSYLFLSVLALVQIGHAQIASFQHVVLIVQENRTPDNFFQGLCTTSKLCSTMPSSTQYNIQTSNWLDKTQASGVTQPLTVALNGGYDLSHTYGSFGKQCDLNAATGVCKMDGAAKVSCSGTCPSQPQYRYVDNSTGVLDPYIQMAQQYGWANYMFQTNQGPSLPAHQFLFGATSAASAADDAAGIFVSGNEAKDPGGAGGCESIAGAYVEEVSPPNLQTLKIFPCFEHNTLPDVVPATTTWKYYTTTGQQFWNAPNAINHICEPTQATGGTCAGSEYVNNVDLNPKHVLTDISACNLRSLTWVIPTAANSDHGGKNQSGGPSWVASIVNAIGQSTCKNSDGSSYWDTTAILVTWDDWGGWYDHEPPTILPQPQGDYQYGFRVPFLFISAYTPAGYIDNARHDFGSIVRFIEKNFGVAQGILGFADARASDSLASFFNLSNTPRPFVTIPAKLGAAYFINDTNPPEDPDDY